MSYLSQRFPDRRKVRKWGAKKKVISVVFKDHRILDAVIAIAQDYSDSLGYKVSRSQVIEETLKNSSKIQTKMEKLKREEQHEGRRKEQ